MSECVSECMSACMEMHRKFGIWGKGKGKPSATPSLLI